MKLLHALQAGLFVVVLGACAEPIFTDGNCRETAHCHTRENTQADGSVCNEEVGRCECGPGIVVCCPGRVLPGRCAPSCSPEETCPGSPILASADAGGNDADAGPDADAGDAWHPECEDDSQCP